MHRDLVFPGEVAPTTTTSPGATDTPGTPGPSGTPVPTATPTPPGTGCALSGADCTLDSDCCSGHCMSPDDVTFVCQ